MNEEKYQSNTLLDDQIEEMYMYMSNPDQYTLFELWRPLTSYILQSDQSDIDISFIDIYLDYVIKPSIHRLEEIDAELTTSGYTSSAVFFLFNGYTVASNVGQVRLSEMYMNVIHMVLMKLSKMGILDEMSILYNHTFDMLNVNDAMILRNILINQGVPLDDILHNWIQYLKSKDVYDAHDVSTLNWFILSGILSLDDLTSVMKILLKDLPRNEYLEESVYQLLEYGANPFKSNLNKQYPWIMDYVIELNRDRILGISRQMSKSILYDKNLVIKILRTIYK
jgi:hypothetical protein